MRVVGVEPSAVRWVGPVQPDGRSGDDPTTVVVLGHHRVRSFEAVFRADHRAVVAIAWALTGSQAVAEELTQEAFLRAHQRWSRVGGYDNPGAWVRRTAINLAISDRRRRAAEQRAATRTPRAPGPADATEEVVGTDRFWVAVRRLPRQQGAVVALHYLEDRSVVDVAAVLGLAEGTVKAHLHKARATLAQHLSLDPEEDR
ncbi:SigE family RNA polymerase sigma factor [soil metagenome]